jgi:hypothetical protein
MNGENDPAQASVQLTVSPVLYAIALRPDDPTQLRAAVNLACRWWGGIRYPWLRLSEDGSVIGNAQNVWDVLDVAGIIDLTRSDPSEPVPAGLAKSGLHVIVGDPRPPWAMPIRGVVAPSAEDPLVVAEEADGADVDWAALVGLGGLSLDERARQEEDGQAISAVPADSYVLPQLGGRTAVGVTATAVDNFISMSAFMTTTALVWVLPDSFTLTEVAKDLTAFWNYRALRPRHRGTVTVIARQAALRRPEAQRRLVEAVSATAFTTPMCVFNGQAIGDTDLRNVAEALGFKVVVDIKEWKERHYGREEPAELPRWLIILWPASGWMMTATPALVGTSWRSPTGHVGRRGSNRLSRGVTPRH